MYYHRYIWLLLVLCLSACAPKVIQAPISTGASGQASQAMGVVPALSPLEALVQQAEAARQAGNYLEMERLYGILARNPAYAQAGLAWSYVAEASWNNKHPLSTLEALQQWVQVDPAAINSLPWQELWAASITHVPANESQRQATIFTTDSKAPLAVRTLAWSTLWLLQPEASLAVDNLSKLYAQAGSVNKMLMEARVLLILREASATELEQMLSLATPAPTGVDVNLELATPIALDAASELNAAGGNSAGAVSETPVSPVTPAVVPVRFPWSMVLVEALQRETQQQGARVSSLMTKLQTAELADKSLITATLGTAKSLDPTLLPTPSSKLPYYAGCYALALPMSGDFAAIGKRIASGAKVAEQELNRAGHKTELKIVNTESAGWLDELASLPAQCTMVGGPLRQASYAAAKERGLLNSRAFFTFLSRLDDQDEGRVAWRFFSSPSDQVTALLRFGTELGISNYATLTPADAYGQRMSELFAKQAESNRYFVQQASYDLQAEPNLNRLLGSLVGVRMQAEKKPVPSSSFQALFLPDSWKNISTIVPYLFFQGEDRLVLMGTALWEQGLDRQNNNVQNMDLAVFPGSWNPNPQEGSAAASLMAYFSQTIGENPDFWVSLGYDFVRLASALNIQGYDPATINSRLNLAVDLNWSMAPLRWQNGMATQYMFLFKPIDTGFELVNFADFKAKRENILARFARRMKQ